MIVLRHTVLPPWLSCDGFGARDLAECAKAYYTLSGFAKLEIDAWFVEFFCARHDFLVASDFIAPCLQEGPRRTPVGHKDIVEARKLIPSITSSFEKYTGNPACGLGWWQAGGVRADIHVGSILECARRR